MLEKLNTYFQSALVEVSSLLWLPYVLCVAAAALIVALLLSCFRSRDIRVLNDKNGKTFISRNALRDLVYLACERAGTPGKPKITFRAKRGRLNLGIRVKLYEGQRLVKLREKLRKSLEQTFEQSHGILVGNVDVIVAGFKKGGQFIASDDSDDDEQSAEQVSYTSITPPRSYNQPLTTSDISEDDSAEESPTDDRENKPGSGLLS